MGQAAPATRLAPRRPRSGRGPCVDHHEGVRTRIHHRRSSLLILGVSLSIVGCSNEEAPEAKAPSGKALYEQSCASCHGADLRGTDKGPSHLSMVYEPGHHPDESFEAAVRQGVQQHHWNFGNMPAIGGLSDEEVQAIIDYVRSVQVDEGFEPYP